MPVAVPLAKRIFLSSTCLDLEDLRSGLKESLEEMGYRVRASEFRGSRPPHLRGPFFGFRCARTVP